MNYDVTIYSSDGSTDEKGDVNAVKHSIQRKSESIFDLLDHIKFFIQHSNLSDHNLAIEIEQNLMK